MAPHPHYRKDMCMMYDEPIDTERDFMFFLQELLETDAGEVEDGFDPTLWLDSKRPTVRSFEEAMVMTRDEGLVCIMPNGDRFFLTIQKG